MIDRRRFVLQLAGVGAGCVGCADASGRVRGPGCGTPADGGGLGYCLVDQREVRVIGGARLATNQVMLTGIDDQTAVIVARDEKGFYALSAICPHACCVVVACNDDACSDPQNSPGECKPVNAVSLVRAGGIAFFCPCHGSAFAADGSVLAPPATSGLPPVRMRLDGNDAVVDLSTPANVDDRVGA